MLGTNLAILEEFYSIQGEGLYAGRPTLFLRLAGCDLCCNWCDSNHGRTGELYPEMRMVPRTQWWHNYSEGIPVKHICFTGGEPLLQMDGVCLWLAELFYKIRDGWSDIESVTIETGGGRFISEFRTKLRETLLNYSIYYEEFERKVSICVDYKLPSSGQTLKMISDNYVRGILRSTDSVKFVILDDADLEEAIGVVEQYGFDYTNVFFSPCWDKDPTLYLERCRKISDAVMQWNRGYRFHHAIGISLQTHKLVGVR